MAWYGQKNYTDLMGGGNGGRPAGYSIAEIGCFLTSFSNLLQKFNVAISPPELNKVFTQRGIYLNDPENGIHELLGWSSVTAYDGNVHITRQGKGGWPATNNAIVKFAFNSRTTGQPTTHFCLVADPNAHTIIDSWDGVIRSPGYYGQPVEWAEYGLITPEPTPPQTAPQNIPTSSDSVYVLQPGDTIWGVAMKFGFSVDELMEHNAISQSQVRNLPVGYQVHLPVRRALTPATSGVTYEALDAPKTMHITKAPRAEKWAFGNVQHWADFHAADYTPVNTDVEIAGIAKVLVDGDVAAYYMTKLDFADCAVTGRPANTIGYNHADVADGPYVAPAPAPAPAAVEVPAPAPEPAIVTDVVAPPPAAPAIATPNAYKQTYKELPASAIYLATKNMKIHEFDNRKPDKPMAKHQGVVIAGTFTVGGTEYGRPKGAADVGLWFGIPMANLQPEEEVYNEQVTLQDKRIMGYPLNNLEKLTVVKEMIAAALIRAKAIISKNKK
jgi:LysM repeat protein